MLVSRFLFLMSLGSGSGCLGLENQKSGKGAIAKIIFRRSCIPHDSRVHFSWFWVCLVPIFMTFVALETGLKFEDSSCWFRGHPRSKAPASLRQICSSPGPSNNNSRIPETDSRGPETETGSLEIEKRVHRIHLALETGSHKDAPQPGYLHKGGRRICYENWRCAHFPKTNSILLRRISRRQPREPHWRLSIRFSICKASR